MTRAAAAPRFAAAGQPSSMNPPKDARSFGEGRRGTEGTQGISRAAEW